MLEHNELRLLPWNWRHFDASAPTSGWLRVIAAPGGAGELGCVRMLRGTTWLGCGPRRLEVCETEDAALLMTLEHGWFGFGNWQVLDAERWRAGGVVGPHLLDEQGSRFATMWHDGPTSRTVRRTNGTICLHVETQSDRTTLLRFPDDLPANPFLRMVLLGACILQSPTPPRESQRREAGHG
jgi:hypothetical protein